MSATDPRNPALQQSQARQPVIPGAWRLPLALIAAFWALVVALFFTEFAAMADKWWTNETYAHGLVVVPLALWLMWRDRAALRQTAPQPWPLACLGALALGAAWLVGRAGDVIVIQQYAAMGLLPLAFLAIAGPGLFRRWSFPLLFMLLAVPFGEFLVMPLMQITADITVALVRLTGVPVYREALSFSLPSGNWEVVEACSGIRYLIASVTLGLLYAYLTYRSPWRRLAFVAVAVVVPIIANGLRAYMIVMIGHLSDMALAVGVDHIIYGWVFFGVVMLLLFWIGNGWREDRKAAEHGRTDATAVTVVSGPASLRPALSAGLLVVALAGFPALAAFTDARVGPTPVMAAPPESLAGWQGKPGGPAWQPAFPGAGTHHRMRYARGEAEAFVDMLHYDRQRDGAELAGWYSRVVPEAAGRVLERGEVSLPVGEGGDPVSVPVLRVAQRDGRELDIAYWYELPSGLATSEVGVKLRTAWERLVGGTDGGAWVSVAVPARVAAAPGADLPAELATAAAAHVRDAMAGRSEP